MDSNQEYAQVIAELDDTDTLLKAYLYGTDLIAQETEGDWRFYHYDSLGTTRDLSDTSGLISDSYSYEAFGEMLNQTGSTDNNYLYTGEQFDAELDNYYLRARYYNQNIGRFGQMDSFEGWEQEPLSLHKYLYTHSDPINGIDPSGKFNLREIGIASRILLQNTVRAGRSVLNGSIRALVDFGRPIARAGKVATVRIQYTHRVLQLRKLSGQLRSGGKNVEEIAKILNKKRRALGRLFKNQTDAKTREAAFARNRAKYNGDKWGPTWQYLRHQGKSWEEIIESSSKPNTALDELLKIFYGN